MKASYEGRDHVDKALLRDMLATEGREYLLRSWFCAIHSYTLCCCNYRLIGKIIPFPCHRLNDPRFTC